MNRGISDGTRRELVKALSVRYRQAGRSEKGRILDEFVKLTKYHRKHAVRLLSQGIEMAVHQTPVGQRIYGEAVREALIVIWEAADRICGKRLKPAVPSYIESLERHGHLSLDDEVREKVLSVSAATIDRLLVRVRQKAHGRSGRGRKTKSHVRKAVPVRTFADWGEPKPGHFEVDLVAHNGGLSPGRCVHSLVLTDVASGWVECVALLAREQFLVVEAFAVVRTLLPIPLLGIDTDNDSAFMNETVLRYCREHGIELTRSRAYLKNDQAWIEQKNGAVVRRFVGHGRLAGVLAAQVLGRLHGRIRLYVNFFQPSFKLREKTRVGAKTHRSYFRPATPCDRLLGSEHVDEETKEHLREQRADLDPIRLLHTIRELQATLAALAKSGGSVDGATPESKSLDEFLKQLPRLWEEGEARPTHRKEPVTKRTWRTRVDPFASVWPELLHELQNDPDMTAKELFDRLRTRYPGLSTRTVS